MGLFDRKNNKNEENNEINEVPSKKEVTFPYLTILVDEVLSMTSTEVSIIGNVRGATLNEGDELYLLGRKGKSIKTAALRIEDTLMTRMDKAEEGTNVSVVLQGLRSDDVEKYDVLSSINCMGADQDTPDTPVNPFLAGLLRESKASQERSKDRDYMGRIMENIASEAIFLTPCMHSPAGSAEQGKVGVALLKGKDGKQFLAGFTDIHEVEITPGLPEKMIQPMAFDQIHEVVSKGPIDGFLINPRSCGFVLTKPFIEGLANHKRKVDNNIKEQKIDPQKQMMLLIPKEDHKPQELFDALTEYMKTEPKILRAWYAVMAFPDDQDKRGHLVIVDTIEETPEIFGAIGRAAKDHVGGMQLNMQAASKVGKMTEKMMEFYVREDDLKV